MKPIKSRFPALQDAIEGVRGSSTQVDILEAAFDSFDNTIVVTDPRQEDNPIVYVNRGFEKITGYSFEEAVGKNCRFLQGDDHDQPGLTKLREGIEKQEFTSVLLRNYRKDGSMFWNELHITPVFDADGNLVLFTGVQNDVTRRETLASERALLDAAISNVSESILITDTELDEPGPRILYANPAFETLTGYRLDEVVGRNPRFLQGPRTERAVLDRLRRTMEAGGTFYGESVNYRKDGSEFVMAWHVSPIKLDSHSIDYWVANQRDVTERRRLERQVLDATVKEQRRVARDLHDGVVQELVVAQMMAANIAKQLESIDAPEQTQTDLTELTSFLKDTVGTTRNLAHNMHAANLQGGGLIIALQGLTSVLEGISSINVSFTFETPVFIDDPERAEHLYRIAQEAANNAVKHSGAANVRIALTGSRGDYMLTVQDDGAGLEGADQSEGMGIRNMRYRAAEVGTSLTISCAEPKGTLVSCRFSA